MSHRFVTFGALWLLVSGLQLLPAADAPVAVPTPPAATEKPATVGVVGKVSAIDPAKNTVTILSGTGDDVVIQCSPKTRQKLDGKIVTAANFKVGDFIVARAHPQADGSFLAIYLNTKAVTPMPAVKPSNKPAAPAEKPKS